MSSMQNSLHVVQPVKRDYSQKQSKLNEPPLYESCDQNIGTFTPEGISRYKSEYLSRFLLDNNVELQETHADSKEDLQRRERIHYFHQISATYHCVYGIATYVSTSPPMSASILNAHLLSTSAENKIHLVNIKVNNIRLINVYKPTNQNWPSTERPLYEHATIYELMKTTCTLFLTRMNEEPVPEGTGFTIRTSAL